MDRAYNMSGTTDDARYQQHTKTGSEQMRDQIGSDARQRTNGDDDGTISATIDMCQYCFDALLKNLLPESSSPTNDRNQTHSYAPPSVGCPLFVTWSKLRSTHPPSLSNNGITSASTAASSSNITNDEYTSSASPAPNTQQYGESDYDLRGCIGTLAPKSLQHALSEFAITSALHDTRFDPIALAELPFLRVGVSLLVKYEECTHCSDWQVGVHGIIIKFDIATGGSYSATYLPEVAYEQRWSQNETVVSLVRKAGYRGGITHDLLDSIRCTRYQSSKHQLSYQEYVMVGHGGLDPLGSAHAATADAVVDGIIRQSVKVVKPCVHL